MSYDTNMKDYQSARSESQRLINNENSEFRSACQAIETQLSNFQFKVKELENIMNLVGTE